MRSSIAFTSFFALENCAFFVSSLRIRTNSRAALLELLRRIIAYDRPLLSIVPTSELVAEPSMQCMLRTSSHYHATKEKEPMGLRQVYEDLSVRCDAL